MEDLEPKLLSNKKITHTNVLTNNHIHTKMGCVFASAQFWMIKAKYWGFITHIDLTITYVDPYTVAL